MVFVSSVRRYVTLILRLKDGYNTPFSAVNSPDDIVSLLLLLLLMMILTMLARGEQRLADQILSAAAPPRLSPGNTALGEAHLGKDRTRQYVQGRSDESARMSALETSILLWHTGETMELAMM